VSTPRWEWRSFADDFGGATAPLEALTPDEVLESEETYLLSTADGDVVKIRDGLVDVKHLRQVDADGLEQWSPVLKAGLPLAAADLATALGALGIAPPAAGRAAYTLDELLEEVVAPDPDLVAVGVRKRRQRYTFGDCMAELTDIDTDVGATRTIAIESENPADVTRAVGELGMGALPNVNFGRGLKVLARFGKGRFAVVDVGTNSVKFHVGERGRDGSWRTVVDRAEVTRLGEGLDQTGRLNPEPMARTTDAIAAMVAEAKELRVSAIAAVGTAGMRMAPNGQELVDAVRQRCGLVIEVISGKDEARLAYRAAISGLPHAGSLVVVDTGGGSSQFTFGHDEEVAEQFSVDVGAVRFTEEFGLDRAVSREVLDAALAAYAEALGMLDDRDSPDTLIAMGGATTNLAAVSHGMATYDPDVVQGTVLDRDEVDRQLELYRSRGADERRGIAGLQPGRAEVILAGACVIRTVLDKFGKDSLTVSDRGLRYGVLAERFG
jgi:exopolyphosphatase/guanosine-5'-triphosphate,3'-diphosphate pyrophosphatase